MSSDGRLMTPFISQSADELVVADISANASGTVLSLESSVATPKRSIVSNISSLEPEHTRIRNSEDSQPIT